MELDARASRLRAALAAVLVRDDAPELRLVREWLDNWSGLGLIVVGRAHQGFTVSLGEHGVGRWIAVFFHGSGGHEPVAAAGTAQEPTLVAGGVGAARYSGCFGGTTTAAPPAHGSAAGGRYAIWVNTATFKAVQELADFADLDVDAFVEFIVKELHDGIQVDPFVASVVNEVHDRGRREGMLQAPVHQLGPAPVIPIN
jgi:hypothetical protein